MSGKSGISVLLAVVSCVAAAETVTLAPAAGVTTNVLQFFSGETAVEIAGPGTVVLNPANAHTGGTTLSGGTLLLNGTSDGVFSPVGAGTFTVTGGTLLGSGTFAHGIAGTGAATIEATNRWAWTGGNTFAAAATLAGGTLEIANGETTFRSGLTVADGASVSVTGGTLGFNTASGAGTGAINVDGGAISNANTSTYSKGYFEWALASISSIALGPGGVTLVGGRSATYAQISTLLTSSVEQGQSAAGVTFDGGNWGYYANMAYEGPTIIKNGAALFLGQAGYIPSTSAVTVGTGSQLRNGNSGKEIVSLTLEDDAVIGVTSNNKRFVVTGTVEFPRSAKVAIYSETTPKTTAQINNGSYQVLSVPVSYADELRSVVWSCANADSSKSYTFSVSTDSTYATLSVTIADFTGTFGSAQGEDSSLVVSAGEHIFRNGAIYVGSGSVTMNGGFLENPSYNLLSYGTDGGGTVTLNGGLLDVKNVRLSSGSGARVDLYLNEGAILRARELTVDSANTVEHVFHFNGGTLRPVASGSDYKYFPRYESAYVGEKGLIVDLCDAERDGVTQWYRFSCQTQIDHDPACVGADGGITIRGTPGSKALFYFGNSFSNSTMNGEIVVERGGNVILGGALANFNVTLLPGSLFKMYDANAPAQSQSLTIGSLGASEAVSANVTKTSRYPVFQTETFSLLSPVEFSMLAGNKWDGDASMIPGVYTAAVYRTASAALDTSLFRLPAEYRGDYSLSVETVSLTEGDYAEYTAVVLTVAEVVHDNLELKENDSVAISSDADYGDIYVGDLNIVGSPVLTLTDGTVRAKTFYLAYDPADGSSASDKHTVSYIQNGGAMRVSELKAMYRGSEVQRGRAYAILALNDGTFDISGDALFGCNQTRAGYTVRLEMNGGAMTVGGAMVLTSYDGSTNAPQGIVTMNAGSLTVAGDIDLSCSKNTSSYAEDGGIFLRGGVLSARNIKQTKATSVQRLVFDGGTYVPNAAAAGRTLSGLSKAHVSTNGAIVSTEKLPAGETYTIAQNLLTDPGLNGAADGGFTKRGAGTLALSGSNTFIGPTVVEAGTLAVSSADAISDDVTVADGAALDLGGSSVTLSHVAASGVIGNGSLSVTGSLTAAEGSFLNVGGDLTLVPGMLVDFAGSDAGWRPVASASGMVTAPSLLKARNAGSLKRCKTSVIDGVLYVCPTASGFMFSVR